MPYNFNGNWVWGGAYYVAQPLGAQNANALMQGLQQVGQQQWVAPAAMAALNAQFLQPPAEAPVVNEEEGDMINDFRVGCDPEFMLLGGDGRTIEASRFFRHAGEVGYDHAGRVAEFRPGPSRGVLPIIKKIQSLVKDPVVAAVAARFRAGAYCNGDCLGGHVHFGFNCFAMKPPAGAGLLQGFGELNERGKRVTEALDVLTRTLEHLDILPENESKQRRGSAQGLMNRYGHYGDVRDCNGHMEYRTMASWLYDPKVAFLCLTAAKLAAADPAGTIAALKGERGYAGWIKFKHWLDQYVVKDVNAARTAEKLLDNGLPKLQVDPEVDFKERWRELGI